MLYSALFAVAVATLCAAVPTPSGPNPNNVFIDGFTYAGSGCPAGSVANTSTTDKTVLTLLYSDYVASIGPGTVPADHRKNCQVALTVHYPNGFQFSIFSVDYRGFEDLDAGVKGEQDATYYFSGETSQVTGKTVFTGPKTDNYLITDTFEVASLVWSPCGANIPININSQIFLTSTKPSASGLLTTDSQDFKFAQIYHLQWRAC